MSGNLRVHVYGGTIGTPYNLPFSPTILTFGQSPSLVLGENGVAFATDGTDTADLTGKICTKWNERESTWRKSWSCQSRGTSQS